MSTPFIEFDAVSFAYGERPVLHNVSFNIEVGHFAAIMGGSGSGKTTLLRLMTGQLRPDQGRVLINGKDLRQFSRTEQYDFRRKMGVLFQFGALVTDSNVFDNVAFPLREHSTLPESIINDLVTLSVFFLALLN